MAQVTQPPQVQPAPGTNNGTQNAWTKENIGCAVFTVVAAICIVCAIFLPSWLAALAIIFAFAGIGDVVSLVLQVRQNPDFLFLGKGYSMLFRRHSTKSDLVISYARRDANGLLVKWVKSFLEREGYSIGDDDWRKGADFKRHLRYLKRRTKHKRLMLIITPDYLNMISQKRNWKNFFERLQKDSNRFLLVKAFDAQLNSGEIDFNDLGETNIENEAINRLGNAVKVFLGEPQSPDPSKPLPPFPGRTWNVPQGLRTFLFVGYRDIIQELKRTFWEGDGRMGRMLQPQALIGPARIGKTRIAAEFAFDSAIHLHYHAVFWIDATSSSSIEDGLKYIALIEDVKTKDPMPQNLVDAGKNMQVARDVFLDTMKRWLENEPDILVVLDHCDNLDWATLEQYLPPQSRSHILLTTCDASLKSVEKHWVKGLNKEDGAELLLKMAGTKKDRDKAEIVAELVEGLPSALIAIGHIPNGVLPGDEKELWGTLTRLEKIVGSGPNSLADRWKEQFESVQITNNGAAELLLICSLLSCEKIPTNILCKCVAAVGGVGFADPEDIKDALIGAIEDLYKYSLVNILNESGVMHIVVNRLLQVWLHKYRMTAAEREAKASQIVEIVVEEFPEQHDPVFDAYCQAYIEHARQCVDHIMNYGLYSREHADLAGKIGIFEKRRGNSQEAQKYLNIQKDILDRIP